ncbi:MAG: hypothetical protein JWP91_1021 [Fibrobacteres bacterium]|nr:hypothetical protein [Fibrobacterota bacterium]
MELSEYSDYRLLLKELYEERKRKDPKFSYRYIALKAGFKSAGFFSQIIQGKSNISLRTALSLGEVFKLKGPDLEYFENLVHFNQAKTHEDKEHFYERILSLKRGKPKTLEASQYELFTKWYYLAVRELISFTRFKDDFKELGDALVPRISVAEAKEAVKVLEKLGLIRKHGGVYERVDAAVTTGDKWKSLAITQFQMAALDLAKGSYQLVPGRHRSHSTLTLSLSEPEFQRIRGEISALRKKILELARNAPAPDRVYQVTFNVYPLSKVDGP